jgi:hypothetical protein
VLGPVVTSPVPALGRRVQGMAIEHGGVSLSLRPYQTQDGAQVMDFRFEDPGGESQPGLLVDGLPRRGEVVGHNVPRGADPHDPPHGIEDLSEIACALGASSRSRAR